MGHVYNGQVRTGLPPESMNPIGFSAWQSNPPESNSQHVVRLLISYLQMDMAQGIQKEMSRAKKPRIGTEQTPA